MSSLKDGTQVILNVVQALGILVGGIWVYYKFFRSRTYSRRAELDVEAEAARIGHFPIVRVKVVLKNVGLSRLPLRHKVAYLYAARVSDCTPGANVPWDEEHPLMIARIFAVDAFVEAQEQIQDEVMFPVEDHPSDPWLGFRVKVLIVAKPPWTAKLWSGPMTRIAARSRQAQVMTSEYDPAWVTNVVIPAPTHQRFGHTGTN